MIQDTFFDPQRFGKVLRKDFSENGKRYLLYAATLFATQLLFSYLFTSHMYSYTGNSSTQDPGWSIVLVVFLATLYIYGCYHASLLFKMMNCKAGIITMMTTPATHFEKYLSRWLICTVGFLLTFTLSFLLADHLRVLFFSLQYPHRTDILPLTFSYIAELSDISFFSSDSQLLTFVLTFLSVQSAFILGSTFWRKKAFIKTIVALYIIGTLFSLFSITLYRELINDITPLHFSHVLETVAGFISIAAPILVILFNWTLAYFRFKETDITG